MKTYWRIATLLGLGLQVSAGPGVAGSLSMDQFMATRRSAVQIAQNDPVATGAAPASPAPASPDAPKADPAPAPVAPAASLDDAWFQAEWEAYKTRFLQPDGRIVDNANGMVSHSEGQGYGMLLAALAHDEAGFETIWRWTEKHLMVGPEGLAAWKWDPKRNATADANNATDGDILIAWALAKASRTFERPDYRESARPIAEAVGRLLIKTNAAGPFLSPALKGFGRPDQPDGPVINLSYYIFPAFDDLKDLAPQHDWDDLRATGKRFIGASRFGPLGLPADWEALGSKSALKPTRNFSNVFGYDAIRIPLYLAWDQGSPKEDFERFAKFGERPADAVRSPAKASSKSPALVDAGYRLILALSACLATGQAIPHDLINVRDDLYYPATLRLLTAAVIHERYPQCM